MFADGPSMWLHTSAMAFRACFSVSNSGAFAVNTVEVSLEGLFTFPLALAEGDRMSKAQKYSCTQGRKWLVHAA